MPNEEKDFAAKDKDKNGNSKTNKDQDKNGK